MEERELTPFRHIYNRDKIRHRDVVNNWSDALAALFTESFPLPDHGHRDRVTLLFKINKMQICIFTPAVRPG